MNPAAEPVPLAAPGMGLPPPEPDDDPALPLRWGPAQLAAAVPAPRPWVWHGYLAPGAVTLLTSQWKTGKTTLLSVLLARLGTSGPLAGLDVAPGRAVVLSEEGPEHWQRRCAALGIGDHVGWLCRPFRGRPSHAEWLTLLEGLARLHARHPLTLLVVDAWAAFSPARSENEAGCVVAALAPLARLTAAGVAVLLLHHPRKGRSAAGQAARGSGALPAFADVLLEMHPYRRSDPADRRRRLRARSRFPETPAELVIEWTADGTDYVCLGHPARDEFSAHWPALRALLEQAPSKLDVAQIHAALPPTDRPDRSTLYRLLERAHGRGLLDRDGKGLKNSPYRYWLPSRIEHWRNDVLACLHMPELLDPLRLPR